MGPWDVDRDIVPSTLVPSVGDAKLFVHRVSIEVEPLPSFAPLSTELDRPPLFDELEILPTRHRHTWLGQVMDGRAPRTILKNQKMWLGVEDLPEVDAVAFGRRGLDPTIDQASSDFARQARQRNETLVDRPAHGF